MLCKHRELSEGEERFEVLRYCKRVPSVPYPSTNFSSSKPLKGKHGYYVARMATYIFFLDGALLAVVGIGHSGPPADDAAALVGAVVTLVTDAHQGAGPHVRVADHALAITCEHSRAFGYRMSFLPPPRQRKSFLVKELACTLKDNTAELQKCASQAQGITLYCTQT